MDKSTVVKKLDFIKEIKGSNSFYDVHAHPFDVFQGPFAYKPSSIHPDLFSAGGSEYTSQQIVDLNLKKHLGMECREFDQAIKDKFSLLNSRMLYAHTGPKVFGDSMLLGGIDRVFLLPILGGDDEGSGQLRVMAGMFGGDKRFMLGYSVPNSMPNEKIAQAVSDAANDYGVKVLKIHPSLQEIDLATRAGVERVETILEASRMARVKVVIHGGLSLRCSRPEASTYGAVSNLEHVDWGITPETVVVAHAGCFGHTLDDARASILPRMGAMLEQYDNLAVDTSGIGFEVLCLVLKHIDLSRILFGSDCLYEKQWGAVVSLMCALEQTVPSPEVSLVRIASLNPASRFLGGQSYVDQALSQMSPIY